MKEQPMGFCCWLGLSPLHLDFTGSGTGFYETIQFGCVRKPSKAPVSSFRGQASFYLTVMQVLDARRLLSQILHTSKAEWSLFIP